MKKKNLVSIIMSLLLLPLLFPFTTKGQCTNAPYRDGSIFTTYNPGSIFNFNFFNEANVAASDNNMASASSILSLLSGDTYYLKANGFGFNIPVNASVCGIRVQIEKKASGLGLWGSIKDNEVKLLVGGNITGSNRALAANWSTTETISTYGSAADLWGTTLTAAEVNSPNFGIALSVRIGGIVVAPSAEVDNIRISIDYNIPLPITLDFFKAEKKPGKVKLQWQTAEEENNAKIIVQRSTQESDWTDLKQYPLSLLNRNKLYEYDDILSQGGRYAYRLKMIYASGATIYSSIQYVFIEEKNSISLYPNPAADFVTVRGTADLTTLKVLDLHGRDMLLPVEKTGSRQWRIDIHALIPGMYVIKMGEQVSKFIKR